MKNRERQIWTFGIIAGIINILWVLAFLFMDVDKIDYDKGELIGYTTMIISFALIFVGVKQYRDKHNGGAITFGQAFKIGLFITLIASTIYVVTWLIEFYFVIPDFIGKMADAMTKKLHNSGLSEAEIIAKQNEMKQFAEWYKNPFFNALITYTEILPVGLIISLISAAILKRKKTIAIA